MANISITANLNLLSEEKIGPKLNSRSVAMLHPDMHQNSPDRGRSDMSVRANARDCWVPTNTLTNIRQKHNAVSTEVFSGVEGQYVKNQYARSTSPCAAAPVEAVPAERQLFDVIQS